MKYTNTIYNLQRILIEQDGVINVISGCNGPYHDPETEARNIAHIMCIISSGDCCIGQQKKTEIGYELISLLTNPNICPNGFGYICRTALNKDATNGIIGHAWIIEGLSSLYLGLGINEARDLALKLYYLHKFDDRYGIWHRLGIDGTTLSPDVTFNHQLWFASVGTMLGDSEAIHRATVFLDLVGSNVETYRSGLIYHGSRLGHYNSGELNRGLLRKFTCELRKVKHRSKMYDKSVGYHSFNLYAYAMLYEKLPNHPFWKSKKFKRIIQITRSVRFIDLLDRSTYSWGYNPPGIELAYAGETFNLGNEYTNFWINLQLKKTFNDTTKELLTKGVLDSNVSCARVYEATRLKQSYKLLSKFISHEAR